MTMLLVGETLGPWEISVDRSMIRAYAEVSGDLNPIHLEDAAARKLGLPEVVAHGMWTMGLSLRILNDSLSTMGAITSGDSIRSAQAKFISPLVLPADRSIVVKVIARVLKVTAEEKRFSVESVATVDGAQARLAKMEVVYG
ncbi:MAG: MaoC/PaaZ C-terminal domain-containing protein [Propionibacteriaceae bacterium]